MKRESGGHGLSCARCSPKVCHDQDHKEWASVWVAPLNILHRVFVLDEQIYWESIMEGTGKNVVLAASQLRHNASMARRPRNRQEQPLPFMR